MKKTFVAAAVLGAFAGSAFAADVTLYGVVDLGLHYQNTKLTEQSGVNKFDMASGQNSGSRFGLKGTEDLGFAKAGFVLENGFDADTGALAQSKDTNRIFGRESIVYLAGDFGTLAFGRTGALTAGTGSYNLAKYAPFSTGWGSLTAQKSAFWLGDRDRMDNTVTYVTPSFAGFKVSAQYSFKRAGTETAGNENQNERYAAVGASYDNGPFSAALVVDTVLHTASDSNTKDSLGVTLGASYDFEVVKLFGQAQYGQHENTLGASFGSNVFLSEVKAEYGATAYNAVKEELTGMENKGWKGYALTLGATAPVLGGTAYVQANYLDSETEEKLAGVLDVDQTNWGIALGYAYPFSKRTSVYTYASYSEQKLKVSYADSLKEKDTEFGFGLVHKF